MRATRTRLTDRSWIPLVASAFLLSLLAIQSAQMWSPSAVNVIYPSSYSPVSTAQPFSEMPTQPAQTSQTAATISTDHFTVQLTFPESADPGDTITVSTTTTAKSSGTVDSLSIEVLMYVNRQLAKATSATILTDKQVHSGNTWQNTLAATIPQNADRSVMVGIITETWEDTSSYYGSYGYLPYYPYYYPSYPYNFTMYYVYEPSYVTVEKSSQQTLPLTYVLATTPEYEQLLVQHKALRQEYDSLFAKDNELSSKYEALRSDYDELTSRYNQLASEYKATGQELSNFRIYTYVLIAAVIGLGAVIAFLVFERRQAVGKQESNTSSWKDVQTGESPAAAHQT